MKTLGGRIRSKVGLCWLGARAALTLALLAGCAAPRPAAVLYDKPAQWPPVPLTQPRADMPRENLPYYWPFPQVPPPKWPEAHPDAKPEPGMSPMEYFRKLCKLESGTFIHRVVKDVEGYYIVRPRISYASEYGGVSVADRLLGDLYAVEDPFGWFDKQAELARVPYSEVDRPSELRYDYVEVPYVEFNTLPHLEYYFPGRRPQEPYLRHMGVVFDEPTRPGAEPATRQFDMLIRRPGTGSFVRYERSEAPIVNSYLKERIREWWPGKKDLSDYPRPSDFNKYPAIETRVPALRSDYGLLWRGIGRPFDRQMGIAGGELIVLDLRTNEILGVRRGFALATPRRNDPRLTWYDPVCCPGESAEPLVSRVLQVRNYVPPKIQRP